MKSGSFLHRLPNVTSVHYAQLVSSDMVRDRKIVGSINRTLLLLQFRIGTRCAPISAIVKVVKLASALPCSESVHTGSSGRKQVMFRLRLFCA